MRNNSQQIEGSMHRAALRRRGARPPSEERGHPAEDAIARLLVMEQSLIALRRYFKALEQDLEQVLGLSRPKKRRVKPDSSGV